METTVIEKITVAIELVPFPVPDKVHIQEPPQPRQFGFHSAPSVALKDLDEITLDRLCDKFRAAVFEKAGKTPPPTVTAR